MVPVDRAALRSHATSPCSVSGKNDLFYRGLHFLAYHPRSCGDASCRTRKVSTSQRSSDLSGLFMQQHQRLPQPLSIAPTDAEYAMDLISQRVAQGLPVLPPRTNVVKTTTTQDQLNGSSQSDSNRGHKTQNSGDGSVDWKKWAGRAATGKNWAADAKSFVTKVISLETVFVIWPSPRFNIQNQRDDSPSTLRISSSNTDIHSMRIPNV